MKKRHLLIASALVGGSLVSYAVLHQTPNPVVPVPIPVQSLCDASLWNHVYPGDPRKFKVPQDRLKVIQDCVTVTGTIINAVAEKDGDWHVRLDLDPQFKSMLNAKNVSGQHGYLVLEPVCENPVSQKDTIQEGSCDNYKGHVFDNSMIGTHVSVTGAFVLDMEHGWQELHPVTKITQTPI